MFLFKLYNYSKLLFIVLILLLLAFVFINVKWGAVATPIYQYGMFSGPMHVKDTQTVIHFFINDKIVDISKYPFAERDLLLVSFNRYTDQEQKNTSVYGTMKTLLSPLGIDHLIKRPDYTNQLTDDAFREWYRTLLEGVVKYPVKKYSIYTQRFIWHDSLLRPINEIQKVLFAYAR